MSKTCGECKFFAQGKNCSYCEHPKATDEEKSYRYYPFSCEGEDKFEEGTSQTRIDWYNNLPQEDKDRFEAMKHWPNQQWFKDLQNSRSSNG